MLETKLITFKNWVSENGIIDKRFEYVNQKLTYYFDEFLDNHRALPMYEDYFNAITKCNELKFDCFTEVEAYVKLYFLERYRRFSLIFVDLIPNRIKINKEILMLDIATGPGAAMYALNDVFNMYKIYLEENNIKNDITLNIKYIEQSTYFREFLHKFTEILNLNNLDEKWLYKIPFHFELEDDYIKIHSNINIDKGYYDFQKPKYSFNLIVSSYFFTDINNLEYFGDSIIKTIKYLKNNGRMIIIGANAGNNVYTKIYEELKTKITQHNYGTKKFIGNCRLEFTKKYTFDTQEDEILNSIYDIRFNYIVSDLIGIKDKQEYNELILKLNKRTINVTELLGFIRYSKFRKKI